MNNPHSIDANKQSSKASKFLLKQELLPSENVQLSSSFIGNTAAPEITFILNNLLSDEDVADLEAKYTPSICEYCSKENMQNSEMSCCDQQELDRYIKEIETKQLEDRISTYFLLRPRRINTISHAEIDEMKRFVMEENYRLGLNIDVPNVTDVNSSDELHVEIKLNVGSKRTFRKLKKKMDRIKIFWPQLFNSQMDPINVWGNMIEETRGRKKKNVAKDTTAEQRNDTINNTTLN